MLLTLWHRLRVPAILFIGLAVSLLAFNLAAHAALFKLAFYILPIPLIISASVVLASPWINASRRARWTLFGALVAMQVWATIAGLDVASGIVAASR